MNAPISANAAAPLNFWARRRVALHTVERSGEVHYVPRRLKAGDDALREVA